MTSERPNAEERRRTVEEELQRIRWIGMVVVAVLALVAVPVLALAMSNSNRIDDREVIDRDALRSAAWRGCARDMLERADQYAAQEASLKSPAIRRIFPKKLIDDAVKRRRLTLPIFNCDPNLCGGQPTVLLPRVQRRFIVAYERIQLPPNPAPPQRAKWPSCPIPVDAKPIQLQD
jgi:hypothetical protein